MKALFRARAKRDRCADLIAADVAEIGQSIHRTCIKLPVRDIFLTVTHKTEKYSRSGNMTCAEAGSG